MNKIAQSIVAATATILLLAGCSAVSASARPVSANHSYLVAVRAAAPSLTTIEDKVLTDSGRGVCSALDDGDTAEALAWRAVDGGLTATEGNAIIQSAIDAFCPTHVWTRSI